MKKNMQNIRIVFFDIDGTLLPFGEKKVPQSTIDSINKLRAKGIKVIVATGKSIKQMLDTVVGSIRFDGYITLNGQICYDENMHMFFGTPIKDEEMEILAEIFRGKRIPFSLISEFSRYINYVDGEVVKYNKETNSKVPEINKYHGEKIYQVTAYTSARNVDILKNILDFCDVTYWAEGAIDIYAKGGGKMNAIKSWIDKLGFTKEETMAFGDGANDAEMLKYCQIGVAMRNGVEITKASADFITDDVTNDGVYKALRRYEIIE